MAAAAKVQVILIPERHDHASVVKSTRIIAPILQKVVRENGPDSILNFTEGKLEGDMYGVVYGETKHIHMPEEDPRNQDIEYLKCLKYALTLLNILGVDIEPIFLRKYFNPGFSITPKMLGFSENHIKNLIENVYKLNTQYPTQSDLARLGEPLYGYLHSLYLLSYRDYEPEEKMKIIELYEKYNTAIIERIIEIFSTRNCRKTPEGATLDTDRTRIIRVFRTLLMYKKPVQRIPVYVTMRMMIRDLLDQRVISKLEKYLPTAKVPKKYIFALVGEAHYSSMVKKIGHSNTLVMNGPINDEIRTKYEAAFRMRLILDEQAEVIEDMKINMLYPMYIFYYPDGLTSGSGGAAASPATASPATASPATASIASPSGPPLRNNNLDGVLNNVILENSLQNVFSPKLGGKRRKRKSSKRIKKRKGTKRG